MDKNKLDINLAFRISYLLDLIWLVDILNIQGFEFLDTTFGLNTLFWSIVWIWGIISALVKVSKKRKDEECKMCKLHEMEIDNLKRDLENLRKSNDKLYTENVQCIKEINTLRNTSEVVALRKQLQMYEDRHQYDLRKRDEAEQKLRKYEENDVTITLKVNGEIIGSGTVSKDVMEKIKGTERKNGRVLIDL